MLLARDEIENFRMKQFTQKHDQSRPEPNPVTYPLEFNKMEHSLGETKGAFSFYIIENIGDLSERNWAQKTLREFIDLKKVVAIYQEIEWFPFDK